MDARRLYHSGFFHTDKLSKELNLKRKNLDMRYGSYTKEDATTLYNAILKNPISPFLYMNDNNRIENIRYTEDIIRDMTTTRYVTHIGLKKDIGMILSKISDQEYGKVMYNCIVPFVDSGLGYEDAMAILDFLSLEISHFNHCDYQLSSSFVPKEIDSDHYHGNMYIHTLKKFGFTETDRMVDFVSDHYKVNEILNMHNIVRLIRDVNDVYNKALNYTIFENFDDFELFDLKSTYNDKGVVFDFKYKNRRSYDSFKVSEFFRYKDYESTVTDDKISFTLNSDTKLIGKIEVLERTDSTLTVNLIPVIEKNTVDTFLNLLYLMVYSDKSGPNSFKDKNIVFHCQAHGASYVLPHLGFENENHDGIWVLKRKEKENNEAVE